MKRPRSTLLGALTVITALVLAACGSQTTGNATPAATTGTEATAAPQPTTAAAPTAAEQATSAPNGGATADPATTLRWSLEGISDLTSIDPAKPGDAPTITVINNVFGGLVRLDDKLQVQPDGASEWKVSDDGKTYTFTLRDGLKFADGTPVTAGDFAYSINRALSPDTASYGAPFQLGHILGAQDVVDGKATEASGIKAVDDKTLEITLDQPIAYFLAQLTYPYTFVVPKSLVESGADWETRAYGTGPYKVQEWKRGQSVLLTANENYWAGTPGIPNILHVFNKDSETAFQLYQTGELDIMGSQQNPIPSAHVA
ncbi:MAG TPA: ABC transporter substrate-binding protein, partial [Roseiflexaceae bacterium]|nr:ABC transporter substrate-binding protein [Roseiflexaceae bacterium]